MSDHTIDDIEEAEALTQSFAEKHNLEARHQALMLEAEMGELMDAIIREDSPDMREEIGDVLFVLYSIAYMEGIDPWHSFRMVAQDNIEKDMEKEGTKVTKSKDE